jgi:hypothetical protein
LARGALATRERRADPARSPRMISDPFGLGFEFSSFLILNCTPRLAATRQASVARARRSRGGECGFTLR